MVTSDYMTLVLDSTKFLETADKLIKALKKHNQKFDAIAFTGMSGAVIGPYIAAKMKKKMIMVRKEDNSHSILRIEGDNQSTSYVLVDDLIATGGTLKRVIGRVNDFCGAKLTGIALYNQGFMCREKQRRVLALNNDNELFMVGFTLE